LLRAVRKKKKQVKVRETNSLRKNKTNFLRNNKKRQLNLERL
jgi:hypothetical protein